MPAVEELRTLELAGPGRSHLAAASGIAVAGDWLYVIGDDEVHLGVFSLGGGGPGRLRRLFAGELPDEHGARKAAKPDLEALCVVPGRGLLALGSGSTPARERGALWTLGDDGGLVGQASCLDLGPLYAALRQAVGGELNVEGVAAVGDRLVLAQRGDATGAGNALVVLDELSPEAVRDVVAVDLGEVDGVGLALSDVAAAPDGDGLLFCAVAEDAPNAYEDGPFTGACVGAMALDGDVRWCEPVDPPLKVEGIEPVGGGEALLVTDDDDRATPARLLRAALPYSS